MIKFVKILLFSLIVLMGTVANAVEIHNYSYIKSIPIEDSTGKAPDGKGWVFSQAQGKMIWTSLGGAASIDTFMVRYGNFTNLAGWKNNGDTIFVDTLFDSTNVVNSSISYADLSQQVKDSIALGIASGAGSGDNFKADTGVTVFDVTNPVLQGTTHVLLSALNDSIRISLSTTVSLLGQTIDSTEIEDGSVSWTDLSTQAKDSARAGSGTVTKVDTLGTKLVGKGDTLYSTGSIVYINDTLKTPYIIATSSGAGFIYTDTVIADSNMITPRLTIGGQAFTDLTGNYLILTGTSLNVSGIDSSAFSATLLSNLKNNTVDSTKLANAGVSYADLSQQVKDSIALGISSGGSGTGNGSADFDSVGTRDTNTVYGTASMALLTVKKRGAERVELTSAADTIDFNVPYLILGQAGLAKIDSMLFTVDTITDITGGGLTVVGKALTVNADSSQIKIASISYSDLSQQVKDSIALGISTGLAAGDDIKIDSGDAVNNPTNPILQGSANILLSIINADTVRWSLSSLVSLLGQTIDSTELNTGLASLRNNTVDSTKLVNSGVSYADLSQQVKDSIALGISTGLNSDNIKIDSGDATNDIINPVLQGSANILLSIVGTDTARFTLSSLVSLLGQTIDSTEIEDGSVSWTDLSVQAKDSARGGAATPANGTANFDTLGTRDTNIVYGSSDSVLVSIRKLPNKILIGTGEFDTLEFASTVVILGAPGWTKIDTGVVLGPDSIKDITGYGLLQSTGLALDVDSTVIISWANLKEKSTIALNQVHQNTDAADKRFIMEGDTSIIVFDSASATNDTDVTVLAGYAPFDFNADSIVFIYKTKDAVNSRIESLAVFIGDKLDGLGIADSMVAVNAAYGTNRLSTSWSRISVPFDVNLVQGEQVQVKFININPDVGDFVAIAKAMVK